MYNLLLPCYTVLMPRKDGKPTAQERRLLNANTHFIRKATLEQLRELAADDLVMSDPVISHQVHRELNRRIS